MAENVKCAYKGNVVEDWLDADGLILLESWAREGYTIDDIAYRVGVTKQALWLWMKKYPEIKAAISNGRELVDYKVENALLKAALGYKTKEVRVATIIRNGKTIETQKETIEREAAPNVAACQTWLYNRQSKKWKNMNARSNILDELDEDTSVRIVVERAAPSEGKNNTPVSSTFEEADTDWQNDVNQSVTIRGMSAEEKAEAKQAAKQAKEPEPDVWVEDDGLGAEDTKAKASKAEKTSGKPSGKASKHSSGGAKQSVVHDDDVYDDVGTKADAHADTSDLDYWPDDWEDDAWGDDE